MSKNKQIMRDVLKSFEQKLIDKEQALLQKKLEVYALVPKIFEIEQKVKQSVSSAARLAFAADIDVIKAIESLKNENIALANQKKQLLLENGYPENYLQIQYDCEKCLDTGYVGSAMCDCAKKEYARLQKEVLSDVLNINEQNFDNFILNYYSSEIISPFGISARENMLKVLDFCKNYANGFSESSENLLFYGSSGLGKTFLSSSIAKTVVENGFSVVYDSCISVLRKFEDEKFKDASISSDKYFLCDLLIIDDLGTEMSTSFTVSTIYHLINTRLISEKPMIINTNLSPLDFSNRYTPAISSRLLGDFKAIRFLGEDIRKIKKSF